MSPAMSLRSVVFPHPLGPRMTSVSPSWIRRFTSSMAKAAARPAVDGALACDPAAVAIAPDRSPSVLPTPMRSIRAMPVSSLVRRRASVDDEEPSAGGRRRAMGLGVVRHLIGHAGLEHERPAVHQLGVELALETQQHVTLGAPMVGAIAGRVLDHADADASDLARAPVGGARLALVFGALDGCPVGRVEGNAAHLHG